MRSYPLKFHSIAIAIVIAALSFSGWYLYYHISGESSQDDRIRTVLLVFTTAGASISSMYALLNNHLAWLTYYGSSQPSALIKIENHYVSNVHMTGVKYKNSSSKNVLNMEVIVSARHGQKSSSIEGLFSNNFTFPAGDERMRTFNTHAEFTKIGIDLKSIKDESDVFLDIGYRHVHFNRIVKNDVTQSYKWDFSRQNWQIA